MFHVSNLNVANKTLNTLYNMYSEIIQSNTRVENQNGIRFLFVQNSLGDIIPTKHCELSY